MIKMTISYNPYLNFYYKQITNNFQMGGKRNKNNIKYIVVHYTGNSNPGATAKAHYKYLNTNQDRYGSAHYFVDENDVYQTIGDSYVAWAVGDTFRCGYRSLNGATNYNSISVEICNNGDWNKAMGNAVLVVQALKKLYPDAKICRHYDVTTKECPAPLLSSVKWQEFLKMVNEDHGVYLDISKDSVLKKKVSDKMIDNIVFYKNNGDHYTAEVLAWYLNINTVKQYNGENAKYVIGGQGKDRRETMKKVFQQFMI